MTIAASRPASLPDRFADSARRHLALSAQDADECRELGQMLGLLTADEDGTVRASDPWRDENTAAGIRHPGSY